MVCFHLFLLPRSKSSATWPGNLRELGNFVKRYLVLRDEGLAISELQTGKDQPQSSEAGAAEQAGGLKSLVRNLKDQAEEEAIKHMLEQTNWNRKLAALQLNISYKALLYKIRQYGIEAPPQRPRGARTGLS